MGDNKTQPEEIILAWLWKMESGLDTAGVDHYGAAMMFEQWRLDLEAGKPLANVLVAMFGMLSVNNREVIHEVLTLMIDAWEEAHDHLEAMVVQGCTVELKAGRSIIQAGALSAHEGAIDFLVKQGRLMRLPGRVERYVWRQQAIVHFTPVDEALYPSKICPDCYEEKAGPHWIECPRFESTEEE